jgi:isoquinoline 1-oxidoreductase beta subunit
VRVTWTPLRMAGATARTMLVSAAAASWNVPADSCRAENGEVLHPPSGRKLSYGALAAIAAVLPVPEKVPLKEIRCSSSIKPRLAELFDAFINKGMHSIR